jgi:hypothetical protein
VESDVYSVRIGESHSIGEDIAYNELLRRLMEFIVRAALARCVDESEWEQEELRRRGLAALAISHSGKAIWTDRQIFEHERAEARRERDRRFARTNQLDPEIFERLDTDLRSRWRQLGYETPSLLHDMKKLFAEIERDAAERAAGAREGLLAELLKDG